MTEKGKGIISLIAHYYQYSIGTHTTPFLSAGDASLVDSQNKREERGERALSIE